MSYDNAFGAEFREVAERDRQGTPVRVVVAGRAYRTDPDDLWNALTDPERLPRWFAKVSGTFEEGGRFQIEGNAAGKILKCEAPRRIETTWEFGGHTSWVHVTLSADDDRTRLTLEHLMPKDEFAEEHWKVYGPGATGVGWDLAFLGLAMHLQSGAPIDQEANAAWMSSDAGKAFFRKAASDWGEAHVSAGEDATIAEEMARRTGDFYSGG